MTKTTLQITETPEEDEYVPSGSHARAVRKRDTGTEKRDIEMGEVD